MCHLPIDLDKALPRPKNFQPSNYVDILQILKGRKILNSTLNLNLV